MLRNRRGIASQSLCNRRGILRDRFAVAFNRKIFEALRSLCNRRGMYQSLCNRRRVAAQSAHVIALLLIRCGVALQSCGVAAAIGAKTHAIVRKHCYRLVQSMRNHCVRRFAISGVA
jgi:hypothetical protein